ncbi:hypothetical protein ACLOJK_032517 [Asimina triloba]
MLVGLHLLQADIDDQGRRIQSQAEVIHLRILKSRPSECFDVTQSHGPLAFSGQAQHSSHSFLPIDILTRKKNSTKIRELFLLLHVFPAGREPLDSLFMRRTTSNSLYFPKP